jgi:hypothetical protein
MIASGLREHKVGLEYDRCFPLRLQGAPDRNVSLREDTLDTKSARKRLVTTAKKVRLPAAGGAGQSLGHTVRVTYLVKPWR